MKKIKKWQLLEIEWVDSSHTSGWKNSKEHEGEPVIDYRTVGYLLQETKRTITVTQSICDYLQEDSSRMIDAIMDIPKVAIKKIKFK